MRVAVVEEAANRRRARGRALRHLEWLDRDWGRDRS